MSALLMAIVLAAGHSSRMGQPKALLLDPDGQPFVVRIVKTLEAAGLSRVVVVTGDKHQDIEAALRAVRTGIEVRCAQNPEPDRGQLSSLWVGLDQIDRDGASGAVVTLVDLPMVSAGTVRAVIDVWRQMRPPIARPSVGLRHGHPVVFDHSVFGALREAPLRVGAKAVIETYRDAIADVSVDDMECLTDVDTPEDYRALFEE